MDDTIQLMSSNVLDNRTFLSPVSGFINHNIRKVLGERKTSATVNALMDTTSGKTG